jgi:hypothetical protein
VTRYAKTKQQADPASQPSETGLRSIHFLRGTLAPFFRASERPIAIACFRLVTRPPFPAFPDRNVPWFLRRIALLTVFCDDFPYRGMCRSFRFVVLSAIC